MDGYSTYAMSSIQTVLITYNWCLLSLTGDISYHEVMEMFLVNNSSVIRQKSESDVIVYVSEGKTCLFFGKFGMLCFLKRPDLRFVLLAYY